MGGDTKTTTSSTAPANPMVTSTVDKILGGVQGELGKPPAVFNESLYGGLGPQTQSALGNTDFSSGINGALKSFGNAASGGDYGMNDPGYATLRQKVADDTLSGVNSIFSGNGRFGSGSLVKSASEGLGNALAGLDYSNFQNDRNWQAQSAQMLPQLFQSSLMPGQIVDANTQATLLGRNDLYRRQNDATKDQLAWGGSVLGGPASASGQINSTTAPATPWWQSVLGLGIAGLGAL